MDTEWLKLDEEFVPKRKVNNKISWKLPHLIGSFNSKKMDRTIEYESLAECLFYYLLELDPTVKRYYHQPVEVNMPFRNKEGELDYWIHVPDVIVFKDGEPPTIYEIKSEKYDTKKFKLINKITKTYSIKRKWNYKVVYPKKFLPPVLQRNIEFLHGSLKVRKYYNELIPQVTDAIQYLKTCTVNELASHFHPRIDQLYIKPLIFHLIAIGSINTDFLKIVNSNSVITIDNSLQRVIFNMLELEGVVKINEATRIEG
jgi:hypothetical protein